MRHLFDLLRTLSFGLNNLTFTQDSIHQSQAWFLSCLPHVAGMAQLMAEHVRGCPDYSRQLHTIYLANDILLKSCVPAESLH